MEKMINSLKKLGLNRYEAQAYIGLTKIITGQADEIAEVSNLPRSRIYDILNQLEKKGFVEITRSRPLRYTVIEPTVIFKQEKENLIDELQSTEKKLEELYLNNTSEVQAPVWLIHTTDNILEKEMEVIKKASKLITLRAGFLLKGEAQMMIKAFNHLPRSVKIKIIANKECYVENEKIEIIDIFKKAKLSNLEIVEGDLPMMKMLIRDGRELVGTFARFEGENNSVKPETAIGVNNRYEALCKNFNDYFIKQFNMLNSFNKKITKKWFMMKAESVKIADGVYWVGALHWNTRSFHGFAIPGTTYNCYLVFGEEKVALIDNVFSDGMIDQLNARIEDAFAKENRENKIDVFIQCHTELDHSIGLKETIDKYPEAEVYASPKGAEFLEKQYHTYSDVEITTVKTGDSIDLGGKTLAIVSAPMLH